VQSIRYDMIRANNSATGPPMKKNIIHAALLLVTIMASCGPGPEKLADRLIETMTMDEKIGQMLMAGVPGSAISPASADIIHRYLPGGIIFYGYNIGDISGMSSFIQELQKESMAASGIPLFVSIDQEGGRVKRITDGVTQFPGNMAMGVVNDKGLTNQAARIIGMELRLCGINMNLAPDIDVNNNPCNPVINTRSFGASVPVVVALGRSYITGLQKSRCLAVAKHFPGHGDTHQDSHKTLPAIHYGRDRLDRVELAPFREAVRAGVACVMTAHIAYPTILGSDEPATLSPYFLTGVLRNEMKFNGIIISDDMEMHAISKKMGLDEAAVRTVLAGSYIILVSTSGSSVPLIFNGLKNAVSEGVISRERINASVRRILAAKLRYGIMTATEEGVLPAEVRYRDSWMKLLEKAGSINSELSRKAVCYSGPGDLPVSASWDRYDGVAFITDSRLLQEMVLSAFGERVKVYLWKDHGKSFLNRGKTLVYCHVDRVDNGTTAALNGFKTRGKTEMVVLSTGNPYPLLLTAGRSPVLFCLSSTEESMRQMVRCLDGKFIPRKDYSVILGVQ